ncbi:MAG: ECF transporter S component [Lachnospiraceae bacterium]|nr:ECF transporter S component [Lachnospiraceae bacterium]
MSKNVRKICLWAVGIALFVVLSMCLQVPVFENYYLCLGYIVMAVYCYSFGTPGGTVVGVLGTVLYCVVISGLRGMPGWALGNIVIGILLGRAFSLTAPMKRGERMAVCAVVIIAACAAGILGVKSLTEKILYAQPFLLRVGKNMTAFIADAAVLILSLPICEVLARPAANLFPELAVRR